MRLGVERTEEPGRPRSDPFSPFLVRPSVRSRLSSVDDLLRLYRVRSVGMVYQGSSARPFSRVPWCVEQRKSGNDWDIHVGSRTGPPPVRWPKSGTGCIQKRHLQAIPISMADTKKRAEQIDESVFRYFGVNRARPRYGGRDVCSVRGF